VVAAGFCNEILWDTGAKSLTLLPQGQVTIITQIDSVGDGIPDWWRRHYFGGSGTTTDSTSCASCDPDGDGSPNLQEYQQGTNPTNSDTDGDAVLDGDDPNPLDPTVGPPSTNGFVRLYNAFGIYTNTTQIYLQANARSTNAAVTVTAAEYFDTIVSTNGGGVAMSALDGAFNSTNEVAITTFTPSFPAGQRHVYWLHARGSDGQWSPYVKVVINPNVKDILAKVKANYSQIADITFTMTSMEFVDNQAISTNTILFRQKGPHKMRWDNQADGSAMIINGNQIGVIDENGQLTPMFLVVGDDPGAANSPTTHFYWDTDTFQAQYDMGSISGMTNQPGSYLFTATPKASTAVPYDSMDAQVDFRSGAVTATDYIQGGVAVYHMQQPSPQEIAPGVWHQTQQNWIIPADTNWNMQHTEQIQTNTIQINTGNLPDSLFDF
jgi:outer membrane lipoprotein-sorting protein